MRLEKVDQSVYGVFFSKRPEFRKGALFFLSFSGKPLTTDVIGILCLLVALCTSRFLSRLFFLVFVCCRSSSIREAGRLGQRKRNRKTVSSLCVHAVRAPQKNKMQEERLFRGKGGGREGEGEDRC